MHVIGNTLQKGERILYSDTPGIILNLYFNFLHAVLFIKFKKKTVMRIRKNISLFDNDFISLIPEYHGLIYQFLNFRDRKPEIKVEKVKKTFLEDLKRKAFPQRPEYRRVTADIDISLKEVLIFPDLLSESFSCVSKGNIRLVMLFHSSISLTGLV